MPKTDIIDERSLSRLQGIDLREHGDQNTARDCVNLRLTSASEMVPYPRPDKFDSYTEPSGYTFACESKAPSMQEFDLHLEQFEGKPVITVQSSATTTDLSKVRLTGSCLINGSEVIIYRSPSGNCLVSGHDFSIEADGNDLLLGISIAEYGSYDRISISNVHGSSDYEISITDRSNNTVYFGASGSEAFRIGVNPSSLALCLDEKADGNWRTLQSWSSDSAQPWSEDAELKVSGVRNLGIHIGSSVFLFSTSTGTASSLILSSPLGDTIQTWGSSSLTSSGSQDIYGSTYSFGRLNTYRFRAASSESLVLEMKSDSTSGNYDITLQEWSI